MHDAAQERTFGDLSIVLGARRLWAEDRSVAVTPTQEAILFDLMGGKSCSREGLVMRNAIGEETREKTVDAHILHLRRALVELRSTVEIEVMHGFGFRMVDRKPGGGSAVKFGDFFVDFDRRVLTKGGLFATVTPQVLAFTQALLSGNLEPNERLVQGSATPKALACDLRVALRTIGSTAEVANFPSRGYQLQPARPQLRTARGR